MDLKQFIVDPGVVLIDLEWYGGEWSIQIQFNSIQTLLAPTYKLLLF